MMFRTFDFDNNIINWWTWLVIVLYRWTWLVIILYWWTWLVVLFRWSIAIFIWWIDFRFCRFIDSDIISLVVYL